MKWGTFSQDWQVDKAPVPRERGPQRAWSTESMVHRERGPRQSGGQEVILLHPRGGLRWVLPAGTGCASTVPLETGDEREHFSRHINTLQFVSTLYFTHHKRGFINSQPNTKYWGLVCSQVPPSSRHRLSSSWLRRHKIFSCNQRVCERVGDSGTVLWHRWVRS